MTILMVTFKQIPTDMHTCLIWMYKGSGKIGSSQVPLEAGCMAQMTEGDAVEFTCTSPTGMSLLLLAGVAIREPIARHGKLIRY